MPAWTGTAARTAEQTLLALRATYEPLLDGLARHLLLPLPGWLPDADSADHWEHGHRGLLARRLVEHLSARGGPDRSGARASAWRKLQRRLQGGDG